MVQIDPRLTLRVPQEENSEPEVTILIPALNESRTMGEFIEWCKAGLTEAGVAGEILIVNSSSDDTGDIALAHGARVLNAPKRGLGRAYLDGLPFCRGKYLILGDCDLTYDFRKLSGFVSELRSGAEFVMGTRIKGHIEDGAMPALHRYFGTPFTTWILNRLYGTRFSDIHCGMRALPTDIFLKMQMRSQSWEYASEMVLKAAKMKLRIAEIPINFYKDREGRLSHHKRSGWLSPWKAGWINLQSMLVNAPDYFFLKPGLIIFVAGLLLALITALFQPKIGPISFNMHWLLFFIFVSQGGFSLFQTGLLGRLETDYEDRFRTILCNFFSYNKGVLLSLILFLIGMVLVWPLVQIYFTHFSLNSAHLISIFGLLLLVLSVQIFGLTLLLDMKIKETGDEPDK